MNELENYKIQGYLEDGVIKFSNWNNVQSDISNYLTRPQFNMVINNDSDYKELKKARTEINKRQKEITNGRLAITRGFCGDFETKCKELETMLKNKSAEIGDKLKAYEEKDEEPKLKVYTLLIKTADIDLIAEIKNLCDKKNVVIKEGE